LPLITYINDNGAYEIGDCLFISDDRIILIHAKYSSDRIPGLRIEDIQVVASQAIKNIRFFNHQSYTDHVLERLFKNCSNPSSFKDFGEFKAVVLNKLQDYRVRRECWIVQPGLSQNSIKKDVNNKIHCLLNFVESIFAINQIEFKLICNK
jgi:hypothetical protein